MAALLALRLWSPRESPELEVRGGAWDFRCLLTIKNELNWWVTTDVCLLSESHFYWQRSLRTAFGACLIPKTAPESSCSTGCLLSPPCVCHGAAVTVIFEASPCFKVKFGEYKSYNNTVIMWQKWGLSTLEQVGFRKPFTKINPRVSGIR